MNSRIVFLALSPFVFTFPLHGSLDEILAPLPAETQVKKATASKAAERQAQIEAEPVSAEPIARSLSATEVTRPAVEEAPAPSYPITEEALLQAIEEEVHAQLRPQGRISLAPMRRLPDLSKHSEPFEVRVSRLPGRLSSRSMQLGIQVENAEGVLGNWDIPFRPHLYSDVWFARAHLRKGDLATVSDFEARQVDLLLEPDSVIASLEVLQRHEYSRDVRPGRPLEWSDLAERSLVRKGQIVDVIAFQGMIGITMRAKAQQDGVRGDTVFLRNLESNKDFIGEVIGEGRVQVTF